jgi:predicted GIY-YIG superfamily endonuclease
MWYVYFLELSNGDVYVGSTNDLRRRVKTRELERYFKSGSGKAFASKRFC